ncbi:WhiB family transcriptional regulator [Streptomyces sp. NPDC051561]|uniref:WhiB family transcriptional regulator n=1 Tax=Streptomyces sp. NPDC051561 TaxID=3365658 RepID=UPI0037B73CEB
MILTALDADSRNWAEDAACTGSKTEDFFPAGDGFDRSPAAVKSRAADEGTPLQRSLNACARCPLATQARCLIEALELGTEYGIRAGLLASEREDLHKGWDQRIREESVSNALSGVPSGLSAAEFKEAISRFANDQSAYDKDQAARGLGLSRKYLLKLARNERRSVATTIEHFVAA